MKHKLDEYDKIIEAQGFKMENVAEPDVEVENDSLTDLMEGLGIQRADGASLILWNDEVNDMLHIILALYEICELDNEDAVRIMMEAHKNGKAVAKSGSIEDMNKMKQALNDRKIEATVEN